MKKIENTVIYLENLNIDNKDIISVRLYILSALLILVNKYYNEKGQIIVDKNYLQYEIPKFKEEEQLIELVLNKSFCFQFCDLFKGLQNDISKYVFNKNTDISKLCSVSKKVKVHFMSDNGFIDEQYIHNLNESHIFEIMIKIKNNIVFIKAFYHVHKLTSDEMKFLLDNFRNILINTSKNMYTNINKINILSKNEENILLNRFGKNVMMFKDKPCLIDLIKMSFIKFENYIALCDNDNSISFAMLNRNVSVLSDKLIKNGLKQGQIVAVITHRSINTVVNILSILKAGGVYLPIEMETPPERKEFILKDSNACFILGEEAEIIKINDGMSHKDFDVTNSIQDANSNIVYIIYTSGTSGSPKGVKINQGSLLNLIHGLNDTIYKYYNNRLNISLLSPFSFDASIKQLFISIILGHTLYIASNYVRKNARELVNYYVDNKIEISDGTPSHINVLIESSIKLKKDLYIKHFLIGGEVLTGKLVRTIFECEWAKDSKITNLYGPTECCVDSTYFTMDIKKFTNNKFDNIPIGKPMPNYYVYVLDKSFMLCPIGVRGTLFISGI